MRDDEVVELEGLFRHIYRRDSAANELNVVRGFKKLERILAEDTSDEGVKKLLATLQ